MLSHSQVWQLSWQGQLLPSSVTFPRQKLLAMNSGTAALVVSGAIVDVDVGPRVVVVVILQTRP